MIAICLGRRELGKTTLALYMAQRHGQTLVLDTRALVPTAEPICELTQYDECWDRLTEEPRDPFIVIQPRQLQNWCNYAARLVLEWCEHSADHEKLAVIIDEAALMDLDAWDEPIRTGPRDRLLLIFTAHRPQDLPTRIRALADYWCCFRMTQHHDLEALRLRDDELPLEVCKLQPREFVLWDDAHGTMSIYRDPRVWYVPLVQLKKSTEPTAVLPAAPSVHRHDLFGVSNQ